MDYNKDYNMEYIIWIKTKFRIIKLTKNKYDD